jgi:preprotein translocase SecE subunit
MAIIGRRPPAAPQTPERTRPRPTATTGNSSNGTGRFGRLRGNIRDIVAELRKVTWPTPEETRNLTIVVIGITAVIGSALGALDALLQFLYTAVNR